MNDINPTIHQPTRRAIVLIPGIKREEKFARREALVKNLLTIESYPLERVGEIEIAGESGQRLKAKSPRDPNLPHAPDIDVFEAYWADMTPNQVDTTPWQKLLNGLRLLIYWQAWPFWKACGNSFYITLGLITGGLLLVLWYLSLVLLVADAISQDPMIREYADQAPLVGTLLQGFLKLTSLIGNWELWALTAICLAFVPVDELVQIARFIKDYFEDKPDRDEVGLRARVKTRVRSTLTNVLKESYDEVFIVSHSFGTIIAIDILADWHEMNDFNRIVFFTLGSPFAVMRYRWGELNGEIKKLQQKCQSRPCWFDFYSNSDWLCTAIPEHQQMYPDKSFHLNFKAPVLQKITGATHLYYYRNSTFLSTLATPLNELL
ncbi:MAG: hypothetical protein ACOX5R_03745 [bacterium]|jgi:hypothetical protein